MILLSLAARTVFYFIIVFLMISVFLAVALVTLPVILITIIVDRHYYSRLAQAYLRSLEN